MAVPEVSFDLIIFGLNLGGILGGGEMVAGNFDLRGKGSGGRGGGSGIEADEKLSIFMKCRVWQ